MFLQYVFNLCRLYWFFFLCCFCTCHQDLLVDKVFQFSVWYFLGKHSKPLLFFLLLLFFYVWFYFFPLFFLLSPLLRCIKRKMLEKNSEHKAGTCNALSLSANSFILLWGMKCFCYSKHRLMSYSKSCLKGYTQTVQRVELGGESVSVSLILRRRDHLFLVSQLLWKEPLFVSASAPFLIQSWGDSVWRVKG